VYEPPSLVLVLSRALRQSQELFRKCLDVYRAVGQGAPADAESALRLELTNGSRIVSLPGSEASIRGFSGVALLIVDEASRVPDLTYYAVRPMLAVSGGQLVTLSTPFGKRGWWHQAWTEGGDAWERVEIRADQCPRIPADFLAQERRDLPSWIYRQEYECSFEDTLYQIFATDLVMDAFRADIAPLFPEAAAADVAAALGLAAEVAPLFKEGA
jgi:hypothetical protein